MTERLYAIINNGDDEVWRNCHRDQMIAYITKYNSLLTIA